jgi:hypothetical protein
MQALQLKFANDPTAPGSFTGLASTYAPDRQGDVVAPGAFDATLAEWATRGYGIPLLWNHDQAQPIGAISTATAAADGLRVGGRILTTTPAGGHAHALAVEGALSMSIGYTVPAGGEKMVNGVRHLFAIDLHEISLVAVPANPDARLTSIKSAADCSTIREFEHLVRDALGLSSRDAKHLAAKGWPVLRRDGVTQRRDDALPSTVTAVREILRLSQSK